MAYRRPTDLAAGYGSKELALVLPLGACKLRSEFRTLSIIHLNIPHVASTVSDRFTLSQEMATLEPQVGQAGGCAALPCQK